MSAAARLEALRNGARNNPDHPVCVDVAAGRLSVVYQPVRNGVTGQIDKRATREAVPALLYVYTLDHDGVTTGVNYEEDLLLLLEGMSLAEVRGRHPEDDGMRTLERCQANEYGQLALAGITGGRAK